MNGLFLVISSFVSKLEPAVPPGYSCCSPEATKGGNCVDFSAPCLSVYSVVFSSQSLPECLLLLLLLILHFAIRWYLFKAFGDITNGGLSRWFFLVQFSRSFVSDSSRPHELQDARLACHLQLSELAQTHVHRAGDAIEPSPPSPSACDLSQHQGLFSMSQVFTSGGQSIEVSASTSVLPMNTQDWSALGWTGWMDTPWKNWIENVDILLIKRTVNL